jgi:hypothetical protein
MLQKELQINDEKNCVNSDKTQNREQSQKFRFIIRLRSIHVILKMFSYLWYICCWRRKEEIFFAFLFELKEKYLSALLVRILYRENIFT